MHKVSCNPKTLACHLEINRGKSGGGWGGGEPKGSPQRRETGGNSPEGRAGRPAGGTAQHPVPFRSVPSHPGAGGQRRREKLGAARPCPPAGTCRGPAARPSRRRYRRGRCSGHDARRGQPRPRCQQPGQRRGGGGWRGRGGNLPEGARQTRGLRLQGEGKERGGRIKLGSSVMRREALPQQGRCPPPGAPPALSLPSCGQPGQGCWRMPSGGSPAGCSAGTGRIASLRLRLLIFLYFFWHGFSARPRSRRCRRGGRRSAPLPRGRPAEDARTPRRPSALHPLPWPAEEPTSNPCPDQRICPGVAPSPACWRQEGVFCALTSAGLHTCAALCRRCGRQRRALSSSRLRLTGILDEK